MKPDARTLLAHADAGTLWPAPVSATPGFDLAQAYDAALAVRALRQARGEQPAGYKIGFTNRSIWARYQVFAPIWGTVWNTTLHFCDGTGELSVRGLCQPRIEPEAVFGFRSVPDRHASLAELWSALDWVAPGFEIVQSHLPDWKFQASDTVADGGLHGALLVGPRTPVGHLGNDTMELENRLAQAHVSLFRSGEELEVGHGRHVLDGPLHALHHFLKELAAQPDDLWIRAGDVVTTGTWTDAWPVEPGQVWRSHYSDALGELNVRLL